MNKPTRFLPGPKKLTRENISCGECRFWSDQDAKVRNGEIVARCLNPKSPSYGRYRSEFISCGKAVRGEPIDTPQEGAAA